MECSDTGDDEIVPPVALDDGNNDLPICSSFDPIDINVLDNDGDPDGDSDSISLESVSEPTNTNGTTNGTTMIITKNGTDWIRYTPSRKGEEVTFEYTISDVDDNTDTAEVTVNVTDACGDITVQVEDQNGNPVSVDNVDINFAGNSSCPSQSNTSGYTCTVDLSDTCENGSYSISDSDYDVARREKAEEGDTGISSKTQTQLCY